MKWMDSGETLCLNCKNNNPTQFLDLGDQPNGNIFPSENEFQKEIYYPFSMAVCTRCWQVQIEKFPTVESMFLDHPYITGYNKPVLDHFKKLVSDILTKFPQNLNSLILDIGANDGSLLSEFKNRGFKTLGVDPCQNTLPLANEKSIEIINEFWSIDTALELKAKGLNPNIITATAVFYPLKDIHDFINGLKVVMKKESIFCAQCVYLKDVIDLCQFDHFYHEHTMIHSISPLKRIFTQHGMKIIDVEFYEIHGGSFVLYVTLNESQYSVSEKVDIVIEKEKNYGLFQLETYHSFANKVARIKTDFNNFICEERKLGKTIFGLGAPLKGNTLLNYFDITTDHISHIVEVNPLKIGKYTPGTHIPIISEEHVESEPDYYVVLAWNFLNFFIDKYKIYLSSGGKFIIPHPEVKVIEIIDENIHYHTI